MPYRTETERVSDCNSRGVSGNEGVTYQIDHVDHRSIARHEHQERNMDGIGSLDMAGIQLY